MQFKRRKVCYHGKAMKQAQLTNVSDDFEKYFFPAFQCNEIAI